MTDNHRYFTVREANALLPRLDVVMRSLQVFYPRLQRMHTELAGNGWAPNQRRGEPDVDAPAEVQQEQQQFFEVLTQFKGLIEEVNSFGCELKDLGTGLVDFYSKRDGEIVLLCWQLGEAEVRYWHSLEAGFQGRQLIEDTAQFTGSLLN